MLKELEANVKYIHEEIQEKLLPENIRKGVTFLGVDGALEGGKFPVNLFATEEEMNADVAEEGDLALVYNKRIQATQNGVPFRTLYFPDTIVLTSAVTTSYWPSISGLDCNLSKTSFTIYGYYEGAISVTYTSTDGITYTKTSGATIQTSNTDMSYNYTSSNALYMLLPQFLQEVKVNFSGLFEYGIDIPNPNYVAPVMLSEGVITYDEKTIDRTYPEPWYDKNKLELTLTKLAEELTLTYATSLYYNSFELVVQNGELHAIICIAQSTDTDGLVSYYHNSLDNFILDKEYQTSKVTYYSYYDSNVDWMKVLKYSIDVNEATYTLVDETEMVKTDLGDPEDEWMGGKPYWYIADIGEMESLLHTMDSSLDCYVYQANTGTGRDTSTSESVTINGELNPVYSHYEYLNLPMLSHLRVNDLYEGIAAYGQNGIIVGDGTVLDRVDYSVYTSQMRDGVDNYISIQPVRTSFNNSRLRELTLSNYKKLGQYKLVPASIPDATEYFHKTLGSIQPTGSDRAFYGERYLQDGDYMYFITQQYNSTDGSTTDMRPRKVYKMNIMTGEYEIVFSAETTQSGGYNEVYDPITNTMYFMTYVSSGQYSLHKLTNGASGSTVVLNIANSASSPYLLYYENDWLYYVSPSDYNSGNCTNNIRKIKTDGTGDTLVKSITGSYFTHCRPGVVQSPYTSVHTQGFQSVVVDCRTGETIDYTFAANDGSTAYYGQVVYINGKFYCSFTDNGIYPEGETTNLNIHICELVDGKLQKIDEINYSEYDCIFNSSIYNSEMPIVYAITDNKAWLNIGTFDLVNERYYYREPIKNDDMMGGSVELLVTTITDNYVEGFSRYNGATYRMYFGITYKATENNMNGIFFIDGSPATVDSWYYGSRFYFLCDTSDELYFPTTDEILEEEV